jgi:hypothetical protein
LEHTDWSVDLVDTEELYLSRLAMYGEGVALRQAPRVIGSAILPPPTAKEPSRAGPLGVDEPALVSRGLSWGLAVGLVTLLIGLFVLTRGRRAAAE